MVGQLHMLLPQEYLDTFEPMCMQAPKTPYAKVKEIVEKEFGKPIHEIYDCKCEGQGMVRFCQRGLSLSVKEGELLNQSLSYFMTSC